MKNVQKGFTLLELMIAVAILGILTLIAYPSYKTYIRRARLSEVKSTLLMNAQNLERYYRQKGTFDKYDSTKLKQNEYFKITLSKASSDHFTLGYRPRSDDQRRRNLRRYAQRRRHHCRFRYKPILPRLRLILRRSPQTRKNAVRTQLQTAFLRVCPSVFSNLKPAAPASGRRPMPRLPNCYNITYIFQQHTI